MKKVMTIFGTRPEAIKMAPVINELKNRPEQFETIVTVTAQHREMLDQVLDVFNIEPDFDLNIMKKQQTLTQITSSVLEGVEGVIKEVSPDLVLVHGDTTTTFAASLAAFYNSIPVGHVEAGLRTGNKRSPFPEEVNRELTGILADLHFSPTENTKNNLLNENKSASTIFVTGNTAIDALQTTVNKSYTSDILQQIGDKKVVLVTAHRRENLGEGLRQIFKAIKRLVEKHEDIHVVYPVHLNPAVRKAAYEILDHHQRINLTEPLGVIDFHNFAARSHLIMTDSGGIQEEAPSLGVPVLVLRDTTERPEGVEAGTLKLAGTSEDEIFHMADELLTDNDLYDNMARASNPYGDGKASKRIVDIITEYFNK